MTTNRGSLLRLKENLEFMQKSLDILKMRRDRLASEISKLLNEARKRKSGEEHLMKAYAKIKDAFTVLGYSGVVSATNTVNKLEVNIRPVSIMGVTLTEIDIEQPVILTDVSNIVALDAALELKSAIEELLGISRVETWIEKIGKELMASNRKVNILEKVLIPDIIKKIAYVEGKLEEEELEEFFRAKRIRKVLGGKE